MSELVIGAVAGFLGGLLCGLEWGRNQGITIARRILEKRDE